MRARFLRFPGGEPHVKVENPTWNIFDTNTKTYDDNIVARIRSFNDLGRLLVLTDALRRAGKKNIHVTIPYFPGARQDRVANFGEALTVKIYADIINAQNYERVTIADPHSDVAPALLNNCRVIPVGNILSLFPIPGYDVAIIPDAGMLKKVPSIPFLEQVYGIRGRIIQCTKSRDTKTGKLSDFVVHTNSLADKKCLIIDDICDGGGTFIALAEKCRQLGAEQVSLYVTHGIFSKGVGALLGDAPKFGGMIDHIYTTNSFYVNYNHLTSTPWGNYSSRFTVFDYFSKKDILHDL